MHLTAATGFAFLISMPLDATAMPRAGVAPPPIVAPAMMVCTADGCRRRFKPYRTRPEWNAYMMRDHPPEGSAVSAANYNSDSHRR